MSRKTKTILKEVLSYVIIILVVVLIRTFVGTPVKVSGTSMYPTLNGKEIMILYKMDRKYSRNDIVVIKTEHGDIIKRVIGLPGETISIENSSIYINSRKIKDKHGKGVTSDYKKIVLKDNEYFCLGDNRENSMDSRVYGPFKDTDIKGTTKFVLFPFSKLGNVE